MVFRRRVTKSEPLNSLQAAGKHPSRIVRRQTAARGRAYGNGRAHGTRARGAHLATCPYLRIVQRLSRITPWTYAAGMNVALQLVEEAWTFMSSPASEIFSFQEDEDYERSE
jgi:hypothetical protein